MKKDGRQPAGTYQHFLFPFLCVVVDVFLSLSFLHSSELARKKSGVGSNI